MRHWTVAAVLGLAALAAAFGLSVLVAEWRNETADLDPLADDIAGLERSLSDLRSSEIRPLAEGVAALESAADSTADDLENVEGDLSDLNTAVSEMRARLGMLGPGETPTPTPTLEPVQLTAQPGLVMETRGMRLTVESYESFRRGGRIGLIIENVDAPSSEASPQTFAL